MPERRLRKVPMFAGLVDDDLNRIAESVTETSLEPGEILFREGDAGAHAYVIEAGELEVLKATERRETLLAVRGPGDIIGEMALLRSQPRSATLRARTAVELLCIPKRALDEVLDTSPLAARALFSTLLDRWEENQEQLRHNERMAQLGTLTAGVAHELNNPAAAVLRSSGGLRAALDDFLGAVAAVPPEVLGVIEEVAAATQPGALGPLARSDLEDDLERWLAHRAVPRPWEHAGTLASAGLGVTALAALEGAAGEALAESVRLVAAVCTLRSLVAEIETGAERISGIVGALKSYAYLDQAPVQDVEVIKGIEDTVTLLAHKLRGITVVREYEEIPRITAFGSELNQVWTNLIDNAADAAGEGGRITLRTRREDDEVVVEIEDDGTGIPDDVLPKIFDAFFTTKGPGLGTGLGLQITNRIVVLQHGGEITVESEPGRTIFRVRLPIEQEGL